MADEITIPFKVGGVALDGNTMPAIKYGGATYSVNSVDGSGAGRNQKGDMMRDQIALKGKWEIEFSPCTTAQLNALLNAIKGSNFILTAPVGSGKYYAGERSCPMLFYSREKNAWLWNGVSMHFIEI